MNNYDHQPLQWISRKSSWRNESLSKHEKFKINNRYIGKLEKKLEIVSSLREVKEFLLDLLLDVATNQVKGVDHHKFNMINIVLISIMQHPSVKLMIGPRNSGSRIGVAITDLKGNFVSQVLPSIDNLSLGQATLLNLFINIILHADAGKKVTEEIEGIVLVDEIDVHLHTILQTNVLPSLIKLFPKVQFILTTHSPLFVLGMRDTFDENGFQLINLPTGAIITTERFSEFDKAYDAFKKTEQFDRDIKEKIACANKPIVFVEGKTDVEYIKHAAELLKKTEVLEKVKLDSVDGQGQLTTIGKSYHKLKASPSLSLKKVLLLYDCDVSLEKEQSEEKLWRRKIPLMDKNPIKTGIENLFPSSTIDKARKCNLAFIDHEAAHSCMTGGEQKDIPETFEVNTNEKTNLCSWLCQNGTADDFQHFNKVFDLINQFVAGSHKSREQEMQGIAS